MDERVEQWYQNRTDELKHALLDASTKIKNYTAFRLISFLTFGLGIYLAVKFGSGFVVLSLLGLVAFFFAVKKSKVWNDDKVFLEAKFHAVQDELKILSGAMPALPIHDPAVPLKHEFAKDLDVFGQVSLYQMLSRCFLASSKDKLSNELLSQPPSEELLKVKQDMVKACSRENEWRLNMRASGELVEEDLKALSRLKEMSFEDFSSIELKFMKLCTYIVPIYALVVIVLAALGAISLNIAFIGLTFPLGLIGMKIKKINSVYSRMQDLKKTLGNYARYFKRALEINEKDGPLHQKIQQLEEGKESILRLAAIADRFDQRNNLLVGITLNSLMVFDFQNLLRLIQWHRAWFDKMEDSMNVLGELEHYSSLGTWAFHLSDQGAYASIGEEPLKAENLIHPFMLVSGAVQNSASLSRFPEMSIITGANMAGKSTYLRTVGVNYVLAGLGIPVCAESFTYAGVHLFSSMRTTDSLQDGKSYFLSELERLSQLIEKVKTNEPVIVLLDEILKGTNSNDKAEGSRHFVEQLIRYKAGGMIATHDLSLCELADQNNSVLNFHYSADIQGNDLSFDYTLKPGICDTMNATFLMKKLGIIAEE